MSELDKNQSKDKSAPAMTIPSKLPLLPVRDIVIFPAMVLPLAVGREKSIKALEEAMTSQRLVFLATQKNVQTEDPSPDDIYAIGAVCEVLQLLKMPDGTLKVLVEGLQRARWTDFRLNERGYTEIDLQLLSETYEKTPDIEALMRRSVSLFEQYVKLNPRLPMEIYVAVSNITDAGRLADTIASHLMIKITDKQAILEIGHPGERLEKLVQLLNAEIEILNIERRIQNRVRSQIEKTQKEYYLTEQMKAIQKELKQKDDTAKELDELRNKIKTLKMPKEVQEVAEKELARLEKMMAFSPEATVIRTYLDWLIALPWSATTKDNLDLQRSQKVLDEDHYGLEKIKERVIEYLAVLKRVKKIKGPILCFVGPPGVGKTSIAKSIARSLGRSFVRISLGGVRDESEIRGHRRTYIGALPGRIIQSMRKAKSNNPVFILDEIDKMGNDWRGDPSAALLEVLDPEQNYTFSDHYLDVEFDLSKVMFITTANSLYSIPPSLLDRLEILRFSGYTTDEKIRIAQKYLIPKQMKEHGLTENELEVSADGIKTIVRDYTHEAGVRNLEREMANLCRKVAKELGMNEEKKAQTVKITTENVEKFLGIPRFVHEKVAPNEVGVATGLAWTEVGGETLTIEVNRMKGKGALQLTGKLGDVMKESAQAALSYIRSSAKRFKINESVFSTNDFHVHVPEGAVPKDGPSAGIAIGTAMASVILDRPVKKDIAMTGEITLRGRVLAIGGLKEKVLAAFREGINTVIFPEGNKKDLTDIPNDILKEMKMLPVKHMDDVLRISLQLNPGKRQK
ncbi:MAG: endopeptidase La [Elusimicrobia bacterium RIFOXYA2_FULL_50_26]|nr:MAG: endopeptidase La [Elusimicrobia bacterium RIFOXYA2_FULL_50_26]OGS23378.1 MAG: endopeptidase La [Elusimicrobia bacterium RIFOXYB2_FULL_50_12]